MRRATKLAIALAVGSMPAVFAAACGGGSETSGTAGNTTSTTGGTGGTGGTGTGGTGLFDNDAGVPCSSDDQCNGGVCVDGVCCESAVQACAGTCCTGGTVCLFDKCVAPGKPCHTANDCGPDQYCETALGDNEGGAGGAGGNCTAPVPLEGKCLDLPPKCDEDGKPEGCIPPCEYHPPTGQLDAVQEWEWGTTTAVKPNAIDVWSTPTVGRIYDGNCDGKVDQLDPPNVIFVSADTRAVSTGLGTCCHCTGAAVSACLKGVLRMLDGRTGQEIWALDKASDNSVGFSGVSTAIGDIDADGFMDVLAVTGEGFIVMVDSTGKVVRTSDQPIPGHTNGTFGWGGGLSIADMDHDGFPEIAYGPTLYSTKDGGIKLEWTGAPGTGGGAIYQALSTFVDLDGAADGNLELLAGRTAYKLDGTVLWDRTGVGDGFPATGDFDGDGKPEVVTVAGGVVRIFEGETGQDDLPSITLGGAGAGGPPTVADFDGDGKPEIGVAQQNLYSLVKPNYAANKIDLVWQTPNHDLSSSVTGSSVFDFEGDGKAEVIYADECFLWVFDGQTGSVRYAAPTTSFTGTEASVVADVDGDGHAEILLISNRADPSNAGWKCLNAAGTPSVVNGVTWTPSPAADKAYFGVRIFGDKASSWVGTRTLWNQHAYHVSNVCDDRDTACPAPNLYGSIPKTEKPNWSLPWLNNFRQNVQDKGIFDAPDATLNLGIECDEPLLSKVSVRNQGLSSLPEGVVIGVFRVSDDLQVATGKTTHILFPGQTEVLSLPLDPTAGKSDVFVARILIDPMNPTFHECKEDNNESNEEKASCVQ
ncbi:MAG: FG-GAP-like repeat-containing protein [Polyangiaceae bacterium]